MKNQTELLLDLWLEARTRFSNQLKNISESDLKKKLQPSGNSVGFLIRHIGEVELLFAKNVFGATDVKVSAKTLIEQSDKGEWTSLDELITHIEYSFETLRSVLLKQSPDEWDKKIVTKEFGEKTKMEALGRIISHTAYHGGQVAMILKHGKPG